MTAQTVKLINPFSKAELENLQFHPQELADIEQELYPKLDSISFQDVSKDLEAEFQRNIEAEKLEADSSGQRPSPGTNSALEKSAHQQVNQYRQSRNLPPLTLNPHISEQARAHSQAMANGRVPFGHQGFKQRVKAISQSISYLASAENVAFNRGSRDPAKKAVQGWIKSPGHRHNMEGKYNLTGMGVAKNAKGVYYFTQIFIRR